MPKIFTCKALAALILLTGLAACQNAPRKADAPAALAHPSMPPASSAAVDAGLALTGRISLSTEAMPGQTAQFFITQFQLQGNAQQGQLELLAPTGNLLAVLRWQPGSAELQQAGQTPQHYADLSALLHRVMGSAAPEPALLFAWLQGKTPGQDTDQAASADTPAAHWQVDLSAYHSKQLILATRLQPLPRASVRIKLDRQP